MNAEYPYTPNIPQPKRLDAPASRLTDEKISDESGAETQTDSALAPAGLKNPFWN